ncbi:MAG TPA: ribonuclease H-like domain-containing protein [Lachnospiraceae bacterium]|nr:ribonuclease H-like domain-containing protein [Lachnospiraceae bacterium]
MLTINKQVNATLPYSFQNEYKLEELLFFDIETTGFSPESTLLYLIGCIYYQDGSWQITQWFADDNESEQNILHAFFNFIKGYKVLIHFNGDGFDIPFINKKCERLKLDYSLKGIESYDIYKKITPFKKMLKLDNYKQRTIEQFLHINRADTFSGGELIQVYANYLGLKKLEQLRNRTVTSSLPKAVETKLTRQAESLPTKDSNQLLNQLLIHNEEDLKGLLQLTGILTIANIFHGNYTDIHATLEEDKLNIHFTLPNSLVNQISYGNDTIYFSASNMQAILKVTLYQNELKFFYDNYKDYYYLPEEDTAIHKSVAFYVDKKLVK